MREIYQVIFHWWKTCKIKKKIICISATKSFELSGTGIHCLFQQIMTFSVITVHQILECGAKHFPLIYISSKAFVYSMKHRQKKFFLIKKITVPPSYYVHLSIFFNLKTFLLLTNGFAGSCIEWNFFFFLGGVDGFCALK